jgi:hypothetical protein
LYGTASWADNSLSATSATSASWASASISASYAPDITSYTSSLFGTASWADNATSASYALSASYAPDITTYTSSLFGTSSWARNAITSAFATSASFATNALTASVALGTLPTGYVGTGSNNISWYAGTFVLTATPSTFSVPQPIDQGGSMHIKMTIQTNNGNQALAYSGEYVLIHSSDDTDIPGIIIDEMNYSNQPIKATLIDQGTGSNTIIPQISFTAPLSHNYYYTMELRAHGGA